MGAKLNPAHVVLIGVRSFESGEEELLKNLNVKIYYMNEIKERGLEEVFSEAIKIVTQGTKGFGISLDLDAIDPIEAPGVGTPEPNGLKAQEVLSALSTLKHNKNFKAFEIAEYNPTLDINHKTAALIQQCILRLEP